MIKQTIFAATLAIMAGGVTLSDASAVIDCSGYPGFSARAVKIAGTTASYPGVCALSSCRLLNYKHDVVAATQDCNPVTGCHTVTYLAARYQAQVGNPPSNNCPADVSAGPWVKP